MPITHMLRVSVAAAVDEVLCLGENTLVTCKDDHLLGEQEQHHVDSPCHIFQGCTASKLQSLSMTL